MTGTRIFRVKTTTLPMITDVVLGVVDPPRNLAGGCSDPGHCPQHSGFAVDGTPMVGVLVRMSGNAFHRLLRERGIIS